jgi:UDP-N-acetylmuramoyl-L-alanine---L-glutamate ligase
MPHAGTPEPGNWAAGSHPMRADATGLERLDRSRVAVWGPGIEGTAIAKEALSRGAHVVFVDDQVAQCPSMEVEGTDVRVLAPAELAEGGFDYVVRSPGVSVYRPELESALRAGCRVTTATAMWLEDFSGSRIVAVTGSKGKTTTAWLSALVLEASGLSVSLGGNMGTPLTVLYSEPSDVYVVEVSSFQAADVTVSPPIGLLTLIAPDHLDWHRGYENYVRDKLNLFDHRERIALGVNGTCGEAVRHTASYPCRALYGAEGRITVSKGRVELDGSELVSSAEVPLRGEHNLVNVAGALTACILATGGLPDREIVVDAFCKMPSLPSRLETVSVQDGVEFVNDALASNPAGTVAALRTFQGRRICLILGGQDRGVDVGPLVRELVTMSPPPFLVTLPGLGPRVVEELADSGAEVQSARASTVAEAVGRAREAMGEEGVVLFSPGAPTPLVEGSYVQRGAAFAEAVASFEQYRP